MGFSIDLQIPVIAVFLQGLLSFFSPCVLPLIPIYIGYLSGGTLKRDEEGNIKYKKSKVMFNTVWFVLGVSVTFFILGLGVSALGTLIKSYQYWITRIGGIAIILLGLYQFGLLGNSKVLGNTHRLPFRIEKLAMSPITAFLMGFTFSFAWTPCVGPVLTSVLLMAASASQQVTGFLLISIYTVGFIVPFLLVGLFTTSLLQFFKKHMNVIKYTVKIGGLIMIIIGVLMFTGKMNSMFGYLSDTKVENDSSIESDKGDVSDENKGGSLEIAAPDFELVDQYGVTHRLSDYKGKTVFLNFWATWCGPCKSEMPDIQELYEEYSKGDEVVILGVAAPNLGKEKNREGIATFLEENGYTYPVLMDETGEQFSVYGVSAFPTTYMIRPDGNIEGYVQGAISKDIMMNIIEQTMNAE